MLKKLFRFKRHIYKESLFVQCVNDLTSEDIEQNKKFVKNMYKHVWQKQPKSFMFFSLFSLEFLAGGYKTHMDLISAIHNKLNAKIYICFVPEQSDENIVKFNSCLKKYYPDLDVTILSIKEAQQTETDVCISLGIATAQAIKYNKCKEKYLHAMDNEALFWVSGTESTITDFLYSQGFYVFANSAGLKNVYQQHNPDSVVLQYRPGIDDIYYPDLQKSFVKDIYKMVIYARPSVARNAFKLVVPVIKTLKKRFGDKLEILLVGENFDLAKYGLNGVCTNLGRFNSLIELSNLYRTCDIGISFITTPTFSYLHLQLMASGVCLVTNENVGSRDFIVDDKNAIVVPPVPNVVAERIEKILNNPKKLKQIACAGHVTVEDFTWDKCFDQIINFIIRPK